MEENPYRNGSPCYLAWEFGYMAALDDMKKMESENDEPTDQHGRTAPADAG